MPYARSGRASRRRRSRRPAVRTYRKAIRRIRKAKRGARGPYRAKLGKSMGMMSIPFPRKTFTTLTYTDNRQLSQGAAGTVANYQYCINDIFDPNFTGAGGQPKYYDTLLGATGGYAPYRLFKVHAAKIKATFYAYTGSTVSDVMAYVGVQSSSSTSEAPQDMEDILTQEYISHRAQGQSQNSHPISISKFCKVKRLFGFRDIDDVNFQGSNSASPSTRALFNVGFLSVDSTAVGIMNVVVQIKYFVELTGLNQVADS